MAELILTDDEKAAETFLEWSDAAIANAVKKCATVIADAKGDKALFCQGAAQIIISTMYKINATETTITLEGVTEGDKELGDWVVTAKRLKQAS